MPRLMPKTLAASPTVPTLNKNELSDAASPPHSSSADPYLSGKHRLTSGRLLPPLSSIMRILGKSITPPLQWPTFALPLTDAGPPPINTPQRYFLHIPRASARLQNKFIAYLSPLYIVYPIAHHLP